MRRPGLALAAALVLPGVTDSMAAEIDQRTAIICLSTDSESLVSLPEIRGSSKSDRVVSSFTQWMFDAEKQPRPSRIRFLWVPGTIDRPPVLEISTSDANHSTVRIMSQTRHGILAATSASARMTNIGWLFAINFKSEHVIATTLFSNLGGSRAQSFAYSCRFDEPPPAADDE